MAGLPLPPEKRRKIIEVYRRTKSKSQTAQLLGVHFNTVTRVLHQEGVKLIGSPENMATIELGPEGLKLDTPPPADPVEDLVERQKRTRVLVQERDVLKDIAGERSLREYLRQLFEDAVDRIPAPPRYRAPAPKRDTIDETFLLQLSDWHAYEIVKSSRVLDLNQYDAETFAQRVKRVVEGTLDIKSRLERGGGYRFPRLCVAANGDFLSGTIHEVERATDAPNVMKAALGCGWTLALALRDLSANFESVDVHGVSGNHGRLPDQRKVNPKDPTRSWDFLVYAYAKALLGDVANIQWDLPDSYVADYQIGPHRILQYHGHDIKGQLGIPFYGIFRWTRNMGALTNRQMNPASAYILGHFHTEASWQGDGEVMMNGSLIGGTEQSFSHHGSMHRPRQGLTAWNADKGITSRWSLYADIPVAEPYPTAAWEMV